MSGGRIYINKKKGPLSQSMDPNKKLFYKKVKVTNPKQDKLSWVSQEDGASAGGMTSSSVASSSGRITTGNVYTGAMKGEKDFPFTPGTRGAGKISKLRRRKHPKVKKFGDEVGALRSMYHNLEKN